MQPCSVLCQTEASGGKRTISVGTIMGWYYSRAINLAREVYLPEEKVPYLSIMQE